jgi:hypothetical protein
MDTHDLAAQLRRRIQSQDRLAREAADPTTGARHAMLATALRDQLLVLQHGRYGTGSGR